MHLLQEKTLDEGDGEDGIMDPAGEYELGDHSDAPDPYACLDTEYTVHVHISSAQH
jgi:hypothetical protein